ncbi:hypothetical protein PG991_011785 [Apiospora marii]|uniref:Uncharacterized protein n=1 Tax=Apiospora marii TaxID=335849 RepID=A0ABR1RF50_9PEZI
MDTAAVMWGTTMADGAVHNRASQVRHVSAHNRSPSPIVSDICIASPMRLVAVATEGADEYVSWDLINHGIWVVVETDNLAITSSMAPVPTSRAVSGGKFPDPRKLSDERCSISLELGHDWLAPRPRQPLMCCRSRHRSTSTRGCDRGGEIAHSGRSQHQTRRWRREDTKPF